MILVGQYDSPYVRRVAVSLLHLGFAFEHDKRSVFGDFDSMRQTNPLGRVPSLIGDDGQVLIDSAAILDWLDQTVGPGRALIPASGAERMKALQRIALACGGMDKIIAANYERLIRPQASRWPQWTARCLTQVRGALQALDHEDWSGRFDQAQITLGCFLGYVELSSPDMLPPGRYPALERFWTTLRERPEFVATHVSEYVVPAR